MANLTHSYKLTENFNANLLYEKVSNYLTEAQKLRVQSIDSPNGVAIQATGGDSSWKKFVGMDKALTIRFEYQDDIVAIEIGESKWMDKAGAAAAGALIFWPLLITSAFGAYSQAQLPKDLLTIINNYMVGLGCIPMNMVTHVSQNYNVGKYAGVQSLILCPKCGAQNLADTVFCSKCGSKMQATCENCKEPLQAGAVFCAKCGTKVEK